MLYSTQATVASNIIQWAMSKNPSSLHKKILYCTRPSMQACKCWMTMRIGFAVVSILTSSRWWVSDLLELITPSDHEGSFKSVTAIYIYSVSECVYAFTGLCNTQEGILYLQEPHPGIKLYPEQWSHPNGMVTTHTHWLKQSHCLSAPSSNLHCVVVEVHSH